jgi:hypothetical protein
MPQAGDVGFQTGQLVAVFRCEALQHIAGAAPDLQQAGPSLMLQVAAKGAHNDAIASAKPKVLSLQAIKPVEIINRIIAAAER